MLKLRHLLSPWKLNYNIYAFIGNSIVHKNVNDKNVLIPHTTLVLFKENQKNYKIKHHSNKTYGFVPSEFQKFMLLVTRIYRTTDEIPDHITSGTMTMFHGRLQVLVTTLCILSFFIVTGIFNHKLHKLKNSEEINPREKCKN